MQFPYKTALILLLLLLVHYGYYYPKLPDIGYGFWGERNTEWLEVKRGISLL